MKDILLIEDQRDLAELITAFLEKEGYTLHWEESGEAAAEYLKQHTVKLLLLDIMLPGMDGFAVCRAVRQQGNVPVIILSARFEKEDKLNGFALGADDYVEKPVDIQILAAKVKALLARVYRIRTETQLLVSGDLNIEQSSRKVYLRHRLLELNVKEYELLLLLVQNPQKTLHKDYLFNQIWGFDSMSENQTLTVHIKMLRAKIEDNPREPKRIQTVWGVGYRYEEITTDEMI